MRMGSLFSGIGGFELAGEWMGWETVFTCEKEEFNRRVLKYYWPEAKHYEDIRETDFSFYRGRIDILTGGFPCQPYSIAGKQAGTEDERHLWPEMLRGIREIQPTWVVGENVRGLVTWNGGLVFEQVQADLEAQGYEVQPFILPAAGVNAPHRRDRIWFVAYSKSFRRSKRLREAIDGGRWSTSEYFKKRHQIRDWNSSISGARIFTNSKCKRLERKNRFRMAGTKQFTKLTSTNSKSNDQWRKRLCQESKEIKIRRSDTFFNEQISWSMFPSQPPVCNGDDGLSSRLDSITFPKWRNKSIEAGGNAIVPKVVYQIFMAIDQYKKHSQVS